MEKNSIIILSKDENVVLNIGFLDLLRVDLSILFFDFEDRNEWYICIVKFIEKLIFIIRCIIVIELRVRF